MKTYQDLFKEEVTKRETSEAKHNVRLAQNFVAKYGKEEDFNASEHNKKQGGADAYNKLFQEEVTSQPANTTLEHVRLVKQFQNKHGTREEFEANYKREPLLK